MASDKTNCTVNRSPRFSFLSEDQKQTIFHGMLKVLQDTGANVHHEQAREIFKKHGCKVDGIRVYIPPKLVRQALQSVPLMTTIFDWEGNPRIYIEENRSYFGPGPTLVYFRDPYTMERRKCLRQDATTVARVCDALPNIGFVEGLVTISDVPRGTDDVYEFADMIQNTTTPIMAWSYQRGGARDIHRIGCIMAGGEEAFRKKPNYILYSEPISPLVSDFHAIDKLMYCAEQGIPQDYSPCAIGGGTVPATHAGQLVVALSESMVGVVLSQLINPGTCIILGGVQSILDMRRGIYAYGAPELNVLSGGLTEMARYCGLPMFGTAGCTDTKVMEIQSGIEATLQIHTSMLTGANFVHDCGYTESGKTGDIFQTVMDDEIISMARIIEDGIEVNEETLSVDVINRVGSGGHYLYEDHTMKWFRKHWRPTLMDRQSYEDWVKNGSQTMQDRIIKKTRDILETHEGPISRVPRDVQKDVQKVVDEAVERVEREGLD
ncbi:trimethylamine methyltransferase [Desulfonatronospira thiodismutans ASO3-1]|uniref:Trimethylamine methyltransferase n=1 Tax=Desulfonatronospira thiodismutans ASO3-1 TaxID=555779 RepID=D6SRJ9_9BACT|nr:MULTISPECIES: trimethylamine methyltransferase family protein [Desulfonatronospira]EFI33315.1 trimethylamine methyltransferase [Desulfonatronospira thiodismutans ASO3-1]RQD77417.1 MAG: trimethylamine methyltransferase [Desulfonatronospira sp. MSAO_Bac3]